MSRKILIIMFSALVLIIAMLSILVFALFRSNKVLSAELARPQVGVLSSDERRMLVHDLETRDPARVQSWIGYFRHTLDVEAHMETFGQGIDGLYALYRKYEYPKRSDYFYDLLISLSLKDHLREGVMTNYVGMPDRALRSQGKDTWFYDFTNLDNTRAVAIISFTNEVVSTFGIASQQP